MEATLKVNIIGADECSFDLCVFKRKRLCNQSIFVQLHPIYKMLKMTAYRGKPSKWVDRCHGGWITYLDKNLGANQVTFSTFETDNTTVKAEYSSSERCLPQTSVSMSALLVLLSRWFGLKSERGGLDKPEPRDRAKSLLKSLLEWTATDTTMDLRCPIELVRGWQCRFPRPQLREFHQSLAYVHIKDGMIVFTDLLEHAQVERASHIVNVWLKELSARLVLDGASNASRTAVFEMNSVSYDVPGLQCEGWGKGGGGRMCRAPAIFRPLVPYRYFKSQMVALSWAEPAAVLWAEVGHTRAKPDRNPGARGPGPGPGTRPASGPRVRAPGPGWPWAWGPGSEPRVSGPVPGLITVLWVAYLR